MKVQCYPVFNDILELAINDEDSEQPSTSHTRLTRSELFTLRDKLTALCADMSAADALAPLSASSDAKRVIREGISADGLLVEYSDESTSLFRDVHPLLTNPRAAERLGLTLAVVHFVTGPREPNIPLRLFILGDKSGDERGRSELDRWLREVHGADRASNKVNVGYFSGIGSIL
jgi:hypothetical protein